MEKGSTSLLTSDCNAMAHHKNYTLQAKYKVFLNYSGAQKGFVEQLCVDLERCDRYPFFDKHSHSLPTGRDFRRPIFEVIEECELGVVVLSEEFFTSKWPMLEFVAMTHVKKRKPNFKIVPIFLGISPSQIHDAYYQKRWLPQWHIWKEYDSRIDVEDWAHALQLLWVTNGLRYNSESGEVKFREEIVECICRLVPPSTWFEDSYIQGKSRLCKVMHETIQQSKPSSLYGVHVVGLYGVGGTGKTTLCKAMCNDVSRDFDGKVAYMELGSESQEGLLKEVLQRLAGMSPKYLDLMNLNMYRHRLMRDMMNVKVFLTIDNVSLATRKQALTLLRANYGPGSVVLVVAHSLDVLKSLKIDPLECIEMPELELEEAKCLFLHHASCVPSSFASNKDDHELILSCIQRCYFKRDDGVGYTYHPLALQTLGKELACVGYDPKQWWSLLHEIDFLNPFEEPFVFAMWGRSSSALSLPCEEEAPEDQISISDDYPISEGSFSIQLENKIIEPEVEMLGMMGAYFKGMLPTNSNINGALKYTMADLNSITKNFSKNLMVGQRGSGSVYWGQLKDGTTVVVKRIMKNDKNVLEFEASKDFQVEVDTLSKEEHSNLVRLFGYLEDENELILVTEYVTNGNLRQHLDGVPYGVILDMPKRCRISLDVAAALKHLHNQTKDDLSIIHRDIKSSDILITDDFHAKVGFGLSRYCSFGDVGTLSSSTQVKERSGYMAHKHSTTYHLEEQNDVYPFGELLVEIFTGKHLVESNPANDECFISRWMLKQCVEGRLNDIIDPKITPTTFDLKILKQILKLATSCLVLEESNHPTMEGVLEVFSFLVGLYSGDLEDESNSKGDEYEVQKEQKWDPIACIRPNPQTLCLEEFEALKGQEPTQHLDEVDSSNPLFMLTKPHVSLFVEDLEQLGTQFEVDSKQPTRQASKLLVAKPNQPSPLFTNIISDVFPLKSDVTYFEMLQEEISKLDYISRLLNQGDDFEQNLTNIGKTSFFLYFNDKDNVFEFYFKNYQGMASIVGVGLECAKVILEDGWRVTIYEISKSKWDDAWKNLDSSSSAMKVTILDPLEESIDNMEDSQASIPKGQCLLLDLALYYVLKMSISSFLPRTSMMHANNGTGTSSSSGNQDIAGSSSSSDEKFSIIFQSLKNLLIAQEAANQLKTKNGDGPPKDPPGDADVKIDTTVHLKLLPGGDLFHGKNLFDATILDDKELKELTSQLDNTIHLEMMFKFLNKVDRKEIHVTVGPISFLFRVSSESNYETKRRHGWYHKLFQVSFGPVNASHSNVDSNHGALGTSKGKKITTIGSANATTCGTSKSVHAEAKGTIANAVTISGGGSSGSSTTTSASDNADSTIEEEIDLTCGGFEVFAERDSDTSTLKYEYRAPEYMDGSNHEDDQKCVPKHHRLCKCQDVKFEGTWLPMDFESNPQAMAEYSLHTSRVIQMTRKDIPEKVVKTTLMARIFGHPKIQQERNEPLKYTQKYTRSIFLNHAMTHLNGEQFRVREVLHPPTSNPGDVQKTYLKDSSRYAAQWGVDPLLGLNSEPDSQP